MDRDPLTLADHLRNLEVKVRKGRPHRCDNLLEVLGEARLVGVLVVDGARDHHLIDHGKPALVEGLGEDARDLFLERGYSATTMPAIAAAAGVALDTVYAAVGPKPLLIRHLIELALSGQDQPVPAEERDYVREIQAEPDPRRKLARYARAIRDIHARLAPLVAVLREAARGEPELAELWGEIAERRARNMRRFVADVAAAGGLREGMTVDEAADLVWATNAPEFYLLLVDERGWDSEQFKRRLADL